MNDATRAALMALATSALNMLAVLEIVSLNEVQLGAINLFIGNAVILIALFWKTGQGQPPPPPNMTLGDDSTAGRQPR